MVKSFTVALLLAVTLLLGVSLAPAQPPFTNSVVPLTTVEGEVFCSAVVINAPKRYLMTADHCVAAVNDQALVNGDKAKEVFHVEAMDVAILQVAPGQPFQSSLAPDPRPFNGAGEKVKSAGYAFGMRRVIIDLEVAAPLIYVFPVEGPLVLMFPDVKSGMSGGPIVRMSGRGVAGVVGINSMSHPRAKLSLQRPFGPIYEATKAWWEKPPVTE